MKELRKILIALVATVACVLVLDFSVGIIFDSLRHNLPIDGERAAKAEYVINKVEADIVIIGSSRAEAHYDSHVIKDSVPDYTVFNCGGDGQKFWYCDIITNCILNRYTPKLIIWDFKRDDLESNKECLSLLYPYWEENAYITERLLSLEPDLKYKLWFNSYRYNGSGSRIIRSVRMPSNFCADDLGYHAQAQQKTTVTMTFEDMAFKGEPVDSCRVKFLERTIERAKSQGAEIIICVSPYINHFNGTSSTIKSLADISNKYNVPLINDSQLDDFIGNAELVYDSKHLNSTGARVYTQILVNQMIQLCDILSR